MTALSRYRGVFPGSDAIVAQVSGEGSPLTWEGWDMGSTALVLGGGGPVGGAWMTGVLAGLCDAGVDPARADVVIGTSAGAIFGSRLLAGEPARELYERQLAGADRVGLAVTSAQTLRFLWAALGSRDPERSVLRLGRAALRARTGPESEVYDALRPLLRRV